MKKGARTVFDRSINKVNTLFFVTYYRSSTSAATNTESKAIVCCFCDRDTVAELQFPLMTAMTSCLRHWSKSSQSTAHSAATVLSVSSER